MGEFKTWKNSRQLKALSAVVPLVYLCFSFLTLMFTDEWRSGAVFGGMFFPICLMACDAFASKIKDYIKKNVSPNMPYYKAMTRPEPTRKLDPSHTKDVLSQVQVTRGMIGMPSGHAQSGAFIARVFMYKHMATNPVATVIVIATCMFSVYGRIWKRAHTTLQVAVGVVMGLVFSSIYCAFIAY